HITVADTLTCEVQWRDVITFAPVKAQAVFPFTIPLAGLGTGYKKTQLALKAPDGTAVDIAAALPDRVDYGFRTVVFAIGQTAPAASPRKLAAQDYLSFVVETFDTLIAHQSARLGGSDDGPLCITVSNRVNRTYMSLGERVGDTFRTFYFPEKPLEIPACRMDFAAWPILDQLAELSGESKYADMVTEMADGFARYGFEERSGLGFFGEEADFDVINLWGLARGGYHTPKYKGGNSGNCPAGPLDRLWRHGSKKMAQMAQSIYYGLISVPETMDYNRFCYYDFDHRDKKPSLPFNSSACAFGTAGARMIHVWAKAFAHGGDAELLGWSQQMADKWLAVQHREAGLVPDKFGGLPELPPPMKPVDYAGTGEGSITAYIYFQAAAELDKRPEGASLARQLRQMGLKLAQGIARFGYDDQRNMFRQWVHLDGTEYETTARYTFKNQAEKDAAVKDDPTMVKVPVFDGCGFYERPGYWVHCVGSQPIYYLALVAEQTNDEFLIDQLKQWAQQLIAESRTVTGPFVDQSYWTFWASGLYIKTLVPLYRVTGERQYLDWAGELADMEIAHLGQVACPDWWRMPERSCFLEGLLWLYRELKNV
ncbi:MAG: hypothetical protein ACTSX7_18995, partial [Alphaproteobacteria bacterium]